MVVFNLGLGFRFRACRFCTNYTTLSVSEMLFEAGNPLVWSWGPLCSTVRVSVGSDRVPWQVKASGLHLFFEDPPLPKPKPKLRRAGWITQAEEVSEAPKQSYLNLTSNPKP